MIRGKTQRTETVHAGTHSTEMSIPREARANLFVAAFFVVLPAFFFFAILLRSSLNIPDLDDYDAVLAFVNQLVQSKSVAEKTSYFLSLQHGEVKLLLVQGLSTLQFYLRGHIDFRVLGIIGDAFILLLAVVLWKIFLPRCRDCATRLAFFIPVSWLIFQLQYCETLNFATPGLQHVAVLPFAIGSIYLLVRGERWAFVSALVFLLLSVASDGNGLLVICVGFLILILRRRLARTAIWLAASGVCIAVYAYHYSTEQSATAADHSILTAISHFKPGYLIAFIGGAVGFPFHFGAGCLVLGSLLILFFVWMAWRGYPRRNPAAFYSVLFLLLTAVVVAGLRSDAGIDNLPSRYAMYPALFLAFAWFAVVEEFLLDRQVPFLKNNIYLGAVASAILFSLAMDVIGYVYIEIRNHDNTQAMAIFEHPLAQDPEPSPAPKRFKLRSPADTEAFYLRARTVLLESIRLGVYRPPPL